MRSQLSLLGLVQASGAALLAFALSACGGSDDAAPGAVTITIGAAGGTIDGPNGLQLVVPPNALAQPTALVIAQSDAGAPALPVDRAAVGAMFELTPHGTSFAVPVTIRVPFDPALVAPGAS